MMGKADVMALISQAAQDYLKTIYKLLSGPNPVESVNISRVADKMEVAAASATNMVKKLAEMKLVEHAPYQDVVLTPTGEKIALEVIRHHRLLELYLSQVLGYTLDEVDAEADRLEHVISEDFEDRIDQALGFPTIDPHGAPIPTKEGTIKHQNYAKLSDVEARNTVMIRQVSDQSPDMLRYMGTMGLEPGTTIEVRERAPFNGPLTIGVGEAEYSLGLEVAEHIFVDVS
jgi:DtxR family Mn-dependent transcriptional regulator